MGKKEAGEVVSAVEKGKEAMKGGLNLSTSKDLKKREKGVQRERERENWSLWICWGLTSHTVWEEGGVKENNLHEKRHGFCQ